MNGFVDEDLGNDCFHSNLDALRRDIFLQRGGEISIARNVRMESEFVPLCCAQEETILSNAASSTCRLYQPADVAPDHFAMRQNAA